MSLLLVTIQTLLSDGMILSIVQPSVRPLAFTVRKVLLPGKPCKMFPNVVEIQNPPAASMQRFIAFSPLLKAAVSIIASLVIEPPYTVSRLMSPALFTDHTFPLLSVVIAEGTSFMLVRRFFIEALWQASPREVSIHKFPSLSA